MIPIVWLSLHDGIARRGTWDQGTLEELFAGSLWPVGYSFEDLDSMPDSGAVVVFAGQHHYSDVEILSAVIGLQDWALVIVTGDEEGLFPLDRLRLPERSRLWTQPPRGGRGLGYYLPPGTPELLRHISQDRKDLTWFYAGQTNGDARKQAADAMSKDGRGVFLPSKGFGQGIGRLHYLEQLAHAKVAPSPSAWKSPDTFRTYEALEAGCVPILDSPEHEKVFGPHPFPVLGSWRDFGPTVDEIVDDWPASANRCGAFWQNHKRDLALGLRDDLSDLMGTEPQSEKITVIMPTSPIPSHPSTEIIEQTLGSIRAQLGLRNIEVLICVDGIRPEQEHRRADYDEYVRRLLWRCEHEWPATLPILFENHSHQAEMTRQALEHVRTPAILFVEHDTSLVGSIPWEGISEAVTSGHADLVRLHHEASILEPHRHLMVDRNPRSVCGVPMMRTSQWSQRPHVARTDYYRRILRDHFDLPSERWMVEDRMHSVASSAWKDEGSTGWARHKLWIYAPKGSMKRSEHLDGRGDDPKWVDR